MGSAGFEPAASSARGWHHTKLDNDPPTVSLSFQHYKTLNNYRRFQSKQNVASSAFVPPYNGFELDHSRS
jgi:hypothetical protein